MNITILIKSKGLSNEQCYIKENLSSLQVICYDNVQFYSDKNWFFLSSYILVIQMID
jgi:hypothetical protein